MMETEIIKVGLSIEIQDDIPQPIINIGFEEGFIETATNDEVKELEKLMTEVGEVIEKIIKREIKKEHERRKGKDFTLDELIKELEEFRAFIKEIQNEGINN